MSDRLQRILGEAIQSRRPVLIDPTDEQIREAAEALRQEGRLICTGCRQPITDDEFRSQRVSFGPRLQAVAHLHVGCEADLTNMQSEAGPGPEET